MQKHFVLGAMGIGAVVATFLTNAEPSATPVAAVASAVSAPIAASKPIRKLDAGHLILHIEGNVRNLRVTWIKPKKSAYNKVSTESAFTAALLDGQGRTLGSYPIDLSRFDRNPANIGKPVRVEGCEVWDTKISMIVNVPYLAAASSIEVRHEGRVLSTVAAVEYQKMVVAGGEPR